MALRVVVVICLVVFSWTLPVYFPYLAFDLKWLLPCLFGMLYGTSRGLLWGWGTALVYAFLYQGATLFDLAMTAAMVGAGAAVQVFRREALFLPFLLLILLVSLIQVIRLLDSLTPWQLLARLPANVFFGSLLYMLGRGVLEDRLKSRVEVRV